MELQADSEWWGLVGQLTIILPWHGVGNKRVITMMPVTGDCLPGAISLVQAERRSRAAHESRWRETGVPVSIAAQAAAPSGPRPFIDKRPAVLVVPVLAFTSR